MASDGATPATHYEVLGVAPSASADELRAAYRMLARRWHPDAAGASADASALMIRLNEAWSVLSDPNRKLAYDREIGVLSSQPVVFETVDDPMPWPDPDPVSEDAPRGSLLQALPVLAIAGGAVSGSLGFGAGMQGLMVLGSLLFFGGGVGVAANVLLALRGDPAARARARAKAASGGTQPRRRRRFRL